MLRFADVPGAGVDPARIDHLVGDPVPDRFPTALCLTAAGTLGLLFTLVLLLGSAASAHTTLAPPLLSAQPCVVTLALTSIAGLAAARLITGRLRRRD